jgi:pimeloyl-ACP methyl ester carboxylesterase
MLVDVPGPAAEPFDGAAEQLDTSGPGEVFDSRPVEVRGFRRVVDADAWQLRFRSSDTRGAGICGITTVMVPRRAFSGPIRPLLSYQCAIDSLGPAGDPSCTLRRGNQWELPFMARALHRGWAVVTTDHTGPRHAFAAGALAGCLVLDGIRAAIACDTIDVDTSAPVGLWGYSGGAQATLCAGEQHPGHAPELNLVGIAAGGIPNDPATMTGTFEDAYDGSLLSGVPLGAIIGVSREHPEVDLQGALNPRGQAMVAAAADMTVEQLFMTFPFLRWGDYLTVPSVFDIPGLRAAFEANQLGRATPSAPVYVYHGVHEQNLPIAGADRFVEAYRRAGADVTYRRHRFGEHIIVAVTGAPGALRFLTDRFAEA